MKCKVRQHLLWANIYATDPGRGFTSQEWACFTGRIESAYLMQRLMDKPCAEQFCDHYELEWPKLKELLAKAAERKTCLQKISEGVRSIIASRGFKGPEDDGVLDHMVRVTTSLRSSFVAIACRTVCPGSPPGIGKRRPAVQEIFRKQRAKEIKSMDSKDHFNSYEKLFQNSRVMGNGIKLQEGRVSLDIRHFSKHKRVLSYRVCLQGKLILKIDFISAGLGISQKTSLRILYKCIMISPSPTLK
uniref:Ankyrin repeat domain 33B n=1 Tax=Podarcis muralis TaxID=64176 RepID=A0A670IWQ0_PODMU